MSNSNYRNHHGEYTSLSPSSLPGSVPVAADDDAMLLPFAEATLETFPPSSARSNLLGSHPLNREAEDSAGGRQASGDEAQGGFPRFLKVATYQPYFNVDTEEVSQRILQSILLNRAGDFLPMTSNNPDLYGPFWICTTLVFVASAFGNLAAYFSKHSSWQFEIGKVNWAAGLCYAYTFLLPLLLYFFLKYIGVVRGLVQLWSLYGYSLFIFIPASVLAVIPVGVLKWVVIAGAGLASTTFVATNLRNLGSSEWSYILMVAVIVLQACFALAYKILFFA